MVEAPSASELSLGYRQVVHVAQRRAFLLQCMATAIWTIPELIRATGLSNEQLMTDLHSLWKLGIVQRLDRANTQGRGRRPWRWQRVAKEGREGVGH